MSQEKNVVKYLVKLRFEVEGVVEKADLIGAIFGQTEGLFGPEMNLQELQKTWKVGRIEINLQSNSGRTSGEVLIPMSTDVSTCALIAAAVENVDKVGPCGARFVLLGITDVRADRRKIIVERAKAIMKDWASKTASEGEESVKAIGDSAKRGRLISYGRENLPAGPGVSDSDWIIVVEGRADIINLLRAGIENTIAVEGTSIPETVKELAKRKRVNVFLDGDRGGDLILKELSQVARIDRVYRAPRGSEVEDLTPVQILEILKSDGEQVYEREIEVPQREQQQSSMDQRQGRYERRGGPRYERRDRGGRRSPSNRDRSDSYQRYEERPEPPVTEEQVPAVQSPPMSQDLSEKVKNDFPSINGTLEGILYDSELKELSRMPVNEIVSKLGDFPSTKTIVFDGIVTQRLVDSSAKMGINSLVGHRMAEIRNKPEEISVYSFKDLGLE